ncbi:MAG: DUF2333 family protein [Gammaproteobacteria bacterium]|nr:DUF2333 family protein [Gammaproteobacteria bacterium]
MNISNMLFKLFDLLKTAGQQIFRLLGQLRASTTGTGKIPGFSFNLGLAPSLLLIYCLIIVVTAYIWDNEPDAFNVHSNALEQASGDGSKLVTGYTSTAALTHIMETLLNKTGGYLSNDRFPPGVFMDNVPNWEFGALVQVRDMTRALRNDISRSQSQSVEDKDLIIAEPQFNYSNDSWWLPATETEYRAGLKAMYQYMARLSEEDNGAQFYARADNLSDWLALVEKRLGSLSQRLSASVGQDRLNTDLAGDTAAQQSMPGSAELHLKTEWDQIDDIFYEARGAAWALSHLFKSVEIDFAEILKKKNALVSLRQIVRELDATQEEVWSPIILNGSGFGFFANHSLVMANYISRANAAVIELRTLLSQG